MSADDDDVAYGIMVPPSRRESDGTHAEALTKGGRNQISRTSSGGRNQVARTGSAQFLFIMKEQLREKDKRIQALEQQCSDMESKYKSELETVKTELAETQETVHLMQSMRDDRASMRASILSSSSASSSPPTPSVNPSSSLSSDEVKAMKQENEDLKFRIQQLTGDTQELKIQLKIATSEAQDWEEKLRKFISERNDAMDGVDQERVWMSTQLSNCEQQILQLQNENISLLLTIKEQKEKQEQTWGELEKSRRENLPVAELVPEDAYNDPTPSGSRFGSKKYPKKIQDEQLRLAFFTAQAYFARKQQKLNDPPAYDMSQSLKREGSSTSFTTSSTHSTVPSSKGQADLLARHMLEKKPVSYVGATKFNSSNDLPLTLVDEIKLEKSEQKREKALHAMLDQ